MGSKQGKQKQQQQATTGQAHQQKQTQPFMSSACTGPSWDSQASHAMIPQVEDEVIDDSKLPDVDEGEPGMPQEGKEGQKEQKEEQKEGAVSPAARILDQLLSVKPTVKPHVLAGVKQTVYAMLEIRTGTVPGMQKRPPLNLAIVLDKSGSMAESMANCKLAIGNTIDSLAATDVLHFVTYSDNVELIFKHGNLQDKESLKRIVERVQPDFATNIEAGLALGARVVQSIKSKKIKSKRMFLFSDGMPNQGVQSTEGLCQHASNYHEQGINISTFGIGAQFNEALLSGLARAGRGDYFFIDSADNIPNIVNKGLKSVIQLAGLNAVFKARGTNGSVVKKIWGYQDKDLLTGAVLGDVRQGDLRQILVEVEVSPQQQAEPQPLLTWELTIDPVSGGAKHVTRGDVTVTVTTDDSKIGELPAVLVSLALFRLAELQAKLTEMMGAGQSDKAKSELEGMVAELRKMQPQDPSGLVTPAIKRCEDVIKRIQEGQDAALVQKDMRYLESQANLQCAGLF